jgi:hypothetical protein
LLHGCGLESFDDLPWLVFVVVTRADVNGEGHRNIGMHICAHDFLLGFAVAVENERAGASRAQRIQIDRSFVFTEQLVHSDPLFLADMAEGFGRGISDNKSSALPLSYAENSAAGLEPAIA